MTSRPHFFASPVSLLVVAALTIGCYKTGGLPPPTQDGHLTGTVTHPERIALPADATVIVRLEDVSDTRRPGDLLATEAIQTEGRQMPVAFTLRYASSRIDPSRRYGVRAEIRNAAGDLLFATAALQPVLADGDPRRLEIVVERPPVVSVEASPPADTPVEGTTGVWAAAARRGVTFRALGNEPSWLLEVDAERLVLITDVGQQRHEFPAVAAEVAGTTRTYRATREQQTLTVLIERRPCRDVMSGEPFEATVTVTLDGTTYSGCGRDL